jgi:hypothetical protein
MCTLYRSHAIFTITLEAKPENGALTVSKVCLLYIVLLQYNVKLVSKHRHLFLVHDEVNLCEETDPL